MSGLVGQGTTWRRATRSLLFRTKGYHGTLKSGREDGLGLSAVQADRLGAAGDGRGRACVSVSTLGFALLALAVCLHLFFFSRGFYSIGWDESARTLDAYAWAAHGTVPGKAWLPFYRLSVGLGLRIFPDLFLTPRIISFLYGMATIPAAGWLAQELFQNRKITLLTLMLSTLFSQRVALSLAPLSSIMFIFMILVTIAMFARWLNTSKGTALLLSGLFGALASTLRYEGWLFGAAMFLVAATYRPIGSTQCKRNDLLLFGLILFSFPAVWMTSTSRITTPIETVMADAQQYSGGEILRKNPLFEFVLTNGSSLSLIGMIAIVDLFRSGTRRDKAIIGASFAPLALLSLVLLLLRSAQTGPSWRDIGVWSMLMVPFTGYLLAGYTWPFPAGPIGKVLASGATVLVLSAFVYDTFGIEKNSTWAFPESDRQAGDYLNGLIAADPGARILIESSKYFYLNIQVASQHPDAFVRNSTPERTGKSILPLGGSVRKAHEKEGVTLFVFRGDEYKQFLDRSSVVAKLKDFGPWSIYTATP